MDPTITQAYNDCVQAKAAHDTTLEVARKAASDHSANVVTLSDRKAKLMAAIEAFFSVA